MCVFALVCFRFLYKTDGGSNGPILVPISRQHDPPEPVTQGNHVVYPPPFCSVTFVSFVATVAGPRGVLQRLILLLIYVEFLDHVFAFFVFLPRF